MSQPRWEGTSVLGRAVAHIKARRQEAEGQGGWHEGSGTSGEPILGDGFPHTGGGGSPQGSQGWTGFSRGSIQDFEPLVPHSPFTGNSTMKFTHTLSVEFVIEAGGQGAGMG